jgi:putative restriction endonuclease
VKSGDTGPFAFSAVEFGVKPLLEEFGPPRPTQASYPFWYLRSDGFWTVEREDEVRGLMAPKAHHPPLGVLRELDPRGGFPPALAARLETRPDLVDRIAVALLDASFPPSLHEDVLDAVGMPWHVVDRRRPRDPRFRDDILRIYERRCAVCGYDGRLENRDLGIDAAHVRWHAAGGPDEPENGLALCVFHHKAFDLGALGLDDEGRVLVSQHVHGSDGVEAWLLRFAGRPLRAPIPGEQAPARHHVAWHRREVFRAPARAPARANR